MKVYFENGELKVLLPELRTEQSHKFLHDAYYVFMDWAEEKRVLVVQVESQWKQLIAIAKRNSVELTQEVEDYYQYQVRIDAERAERKRVEEQRKQAIARGDGKQSGGCGFCEHLEYVNAHTEMVNGERVYVAGTHHCSYAMRVCRYKADELEYQFEIRKEMRNYVPTIGYNPPAFVAKPYPCAGCKYLEASDKAWAEINKEKENV